MDLKPLGAFERQLCCLGAVQKEGEQVSPAGRQEASPKLRDAVARGRTELLEAVRMTPRELQVISLIAEGLSNKEIAGRMHIATHTVKSHVRNVMEKLTLHTRLQIAAYAHRDS